MPIRLPENLFPWKIRSLLIDQKELYDLSGNLLYTVEDGKKGERVSDGILQVTYSEEEKETVDGESEYVEVDKTDYYDLKGKKLFSEMDTADSKMVLGTIRRSNKIEQNRRIFR